MTDADCMAFLQWALPRLELRWRGFRNVRRQVCKRLRRRIAELDLPDLAAYRARLEADSAEWRVLQGLCAITISRFYRDRGVWDTLRDGVLPALADAALAAGDGELRCWSIGCASGEEPYTLSILWSLALAHRYPELRFRIVATDVDPRVLERARAAEYAAGTLRDFPSGWLSHAFEQCNGLFRLRERFREAVEFRLEDVRLAVPAETFSVVLCRNLVCTYFDDGLQRSTLERILERLDRGGVFVLGRHEQLLAGTPLEPWYPEHGIYRHVPAGGRQGLGQPAQERVPRR